MFGIIAARLKHPGGLLAAALVALVSANALLAQNPTQPLTETPLAARDAARRRRIARQAKASARFKTMVVRGAMLIDGTGGPPRGPVDIVVTRQPDHGDSQRRHAGRAAARRIARRRPITRSTRPGCT